MDENKLYDIVGAKSKLIWVTIIDIEKHMKFERFLENVKGYKKSERYDKETNITYISFHDWENVEYPGTFVMNNQVAVFARGHKEQNIFTDSYITVSKQIENIIVEYKQWIRKQKIKNLL